MKAVPLTEFEKYKTRDILVEVLNTPPPPTRDKLYGGVTPSEMAFRIDAIKKIKEADKEVLLEDVDHAQLNQIVQSFPFSIIHADILAICRLVEKAETIDVQKLPAAKKRAA